MNTENNTPEENGDQKVEKKRNRFLQLLIDFYHKTDVFYFGLWIAGAGYLLEVNNFVVLGFFVMLQDVRHRVKVLGSGIDDIDLTATVNLEMSKLNIDFFKKMFENIKVTKDQEKEFKVNAWMRVQYQGKEYDVIASNLRERIYCIEWNDEDPTVQQLWVRAENCTPIEKVVEETNTP